MNSEDSSPKTADTVELARQRLTEAEDSVRAAKHESRLARQRRKEAKQAARRAKKRLKRAKKELAEATCLFSQAEEERGRGTRTVAKSKKGTKTRSAKPGKATKKEQAVEFSVVEPLPQHTAQAEDIQCQDGGSEPAGESVLQIPVVEGTDKPANQ